MLERSAGLMRAPNHVKMALTFFRLSMTGHERLLRNNVFLAAVTALALGFALIPPYGLTGAAIATASGIALQNLLCVLQVRRVLGFNTLAIWR
jgi:O-antigen/teichoic acid export membrane protein